MRFDCTLHVAAHFRQNVVPRGLDALVYTSVFCADLRLEFGGKTIAGLSAAPSNQWDRRPPVCYFNRTKVVMGVGTIDFLGF